MARFTALLAVTVFALSGCQLPTAGSTQYEGTVTAVDREKVVMSNPVVTGRSDHAVPVLCRLPWIGSYFRSVGVGREAMNGQVEILRTEIRSIDVCSGKNDGVEPADNMAASHVPSP
jgi:hypothetical protein